MYYTLQCVYIHIRPENQQTENKQKPENVKEACGQIGVIWTHTVSPYVSLTSKIATAYIYIYLLFIPTNIFVSTIKNTFVKKTI